MTRAAIYARYSTDQQRDASIEDQVRLCRERAAREGWDVGEVYADAALSGASLMRPGIQQLMKDDLGGRFDVVVVEALDRLSRDQEDIAGGLQAPALCRGVAHHAFGRRDRGSSHRP
jgi:DNA invertase Pin-like site-specific DNA recombinase